MFRLSRIIGAALSLLFVPASFAWDATGHRVVAMIAWEDLTPKTRSAVIEILKQHPRYEKDLLSNKTADESPDELVATAFATAATWPDMVRGQSNPMNATHNHPAWHYIDIPFATGGVTPEERPSNAKGPANIVEALTQCTAELKDPAKSPADKAVDICWVEHLVGDIHQPLHAISLFSPEYPNGDQGGNAEMVLKNPPYPDSAVKLHTMWDTLAGDFQSEEFSHLEAIGLHSDPKYSREKYKDALGITDFMAWAKESHDLAVENVYLNGKLHTAPARGRREGPSSQPIPAAPEGYTANAERLALSRLSLAGYRLADVLNGIFDPAK